MHRYVLIVFLSFMASDIRAQSVANFTLRNGSRFTTEIVAMTDSVLVTNEGNFNFAKIDSVDFVSGALEKYVRALIKSDVIVIRKDKVVDPNDFKVQTSIGIGLGIDYGGIGTRAAVYPDKSFGLFLTAGYPFMMKFAWDAGLVIRFLPKKRVTPVAMYMYGFNAAIITFNAGFRDIYRGSTFGIGFDSKSRRTIGNYFSLRMMIPSRSEQFDNDLRSLRTRAVVKEPWPVIFSVGFHYPFVKSKEPSQFR